MVTINQQLFGNEEFHNGEVIFKGVQLDNNTNIIEVRFENNKDIANMLMASKYIRDKKPEAKLILRIMYLPYSRTDREIPEGNQIFSLKYFAEIINNEKFDSVEVLDLHSPVSRKLLNNVAEIDLIGYIEKVIGMFKPDYLFYPDKGANEKYTELLKDINIPHFYGTKKRDLADKGHIIEDAYEFHDVPEITANKRVLIIDDLVSLGGTAYVTAKQLINKLGVSDVALWVAHCENGVFVGKLLKGDEHGSRWLSTVYTAATTPLTKEDKNLIVVKL